MNLLDLCYKYDIEIDFDGDFDGGCYHVVLNYLVATQRDVCTTKTELTLHQPDIDELYLGAKKLIKILEKHVSEGY